MNRTIVLILVFLIIGQAALFAWDAEKMNRLFLEGEAFYEKRKYQEAIRKFEEVLEIYPDNVFAQEYIANAKKKMLLEPIEENRKEKRDELWQKEDQRQGMIFLKKQEKLMRMQEKQRVGEERFNKLMKIRQQRKDLLEAQKKSLEQMKQKEKEAAEQQKEQAKKLEQDMQQAMQKAQEEAAVKEVKSESEINRELAEEKIKKGFAK